MTNTSKPKELWTQRDCSQREVMENGLKVRASMSSDSFRASTSRVKCKGWVPKVYVLYELPTPFARYVMVGVIWVESPNSKCDCGVTVTELEGVAQGRRR